MAEHQTLLSAETFVEERHRSSVLSAAFGPKFAVTHALDHALCVWTAQRNTSSDSWPENFDEFVRASYHDLMEADFKPHYLPPNSIPFFAWDTFACADIYTFLARSASPWYMLDMTTPRPSNVIPSRLFVPYRDTSTVRSENVTQGFKRAPLWFIRHDGCLGVPVEGNRPLLWHGEKAFRRYDGTWRMTMKMKFSWPGYDEWEKQIRLESDTGDRSVNRLAGLVANKVRDFINGHHTDVHRYVGTRARWRIGSLTGQISASDVLLLGILLVSDGAAMPILKVRDDFVFAA